MTAFERVFKRIQKSSKPKTKAERAQLRKDLIELAERAAEARRAGKPVELSPYLKSLMKLEGVKFPKGK